MQVLVVLLVLLGGVAADGVAEQRGHGEKGTRAPLLPRPVWRRVCGGSASPRGPVGQ
jgi:hypothetical protein